MNLTTMLVMTTIFISKMEGLPPTSDIKMIDIWLVLCQMVPFAEVVLLTAMEYQRTEEEDDVPKSGCVNVIPVKIEEIENEETEKEKWHLNLKWLIPSLKTLGKFDKIFVYLFNIYLSEKKVLPSLMLAIATIYFGVAAIVYLD